MGPDQFMGKWFAVPAALEVLVFQAWGLLTYMFLHLDFWHLFANMFWLYYLGQLFVQFLGEKKLLSLYLVGGIAGGLLYIIAFNLFPVFKGILPVSRALGASASVMAIVVGLATYAPNYAIRIVLIGDVKLKYIAIFSFVMDVLSVSGTNSGGHIAHLGGAALGYYFAKEWGKGKDITAWIYVPINFIASLFKSSSASKLKVKYKSKKKKSSKKSDNQSEVDAILDKISRSGYESLSKSEKETLFKASNQP